MRPYPVELAKELIYARFKDVRKIGEDSFKVTCPFHKNGQEAHPSLCISLKIMAFNCFVCGAHGRLTDLLGPSNIPGEKPVYANGSYFFRSSTAQTRYVPTRSYSTADFIIDSGIFSQFEMDKFPGLEKFSEDVLREHKVGYDPFYNRTIFPVFDIGGNLRLISGRSYNGFPRYRAYTADMLRGYVPTNYVPRKKWLFGEDKLENGEIIVVEGFKACLWLRQFGFNCVAIMGTIPTREQLNKLSALGREIFVMLDNDDPGKASAEKLVTILDKKAKSRHKQVAHLVDFSFTGKHQPDDLTFEEICQALCDAGFNPLHIDANLC
jgi:DNA primase